MRLCLSAGFHHRVDTPQALQIQLPAEFRAVGPGWTLAVGDLHPNSPHRLLYRTRVFLIAWENFSSIGFPCLGFLWSLVLVLLLPIYNP